VSHQILVFLEEVPGRWRKLNNPELHDGQGMWHVQVTVLWWRNLKQRHCWEDVDTEVRMTLKWMGGHELNSSCQGKCKMAGSCKTGILTKGWEFLN
jgi:hypothetical protein